MKLTLLKCIFAAHMQTSILVHSLCDNEIEVGNAPHSMQRV